MAVEVFHPVTKTVEVVIKALNRGQQRVNVIHYSYGNNPRPTVAQLIALLNGVNTNVVTGLQDVSANTCVYYELDARDIQDAGGAQASLAINRTGSRAGGVAPGNVAIVMSKRSGIPGRRNRGRLYTHDLDETMIDGDNVTSSLQSLLVQLGVDMLLALVSNYFTAAIASKTAGSSVPMTSVQFDTITDSQIRRLTGRGT